MQLDLLESQVEQVLEDLSQTEEVFASARKAKSDTAIMSGIADKAFAFYSRLGNHIEWLFQVRRAVNPEDRRVVEMLLASCRGARGSLLPYFRYLCSPESGSAPPLVDRTERASSRALMHRFAGASWLEEYKGLLQDVSLGHWEEERPGEFSNQEYIRISELPLEEFGWKDAVRGLYGVFTGQSARLGYKDVSLGCHYLFLAEERVWFGYTWHEKSDVSPYIGVHLTEKRTTSKRLELGGGVYWRHGRWETLSGGESRLAYVGPTLGPKSTPWYRQKEEKGDMPLFRLLARRMDKRQARGRRLQAGGQAEGLPPAVVHLKP